MRKDNVVLEFNDEYLIRVDSQNWMPVRLGINEKEGSKNFGQPTEFPIGYCHNLGFAIRCIVRDMVDREHVPEEVTRAEEMIDWYFAEQKKIYDQISLLKEELTEALETNGVI